MESIILAWIMLWQMVITVLGAIAVMKIMLPHDPRDRLKRPFRDVDELNNANRMNEIHMCMNKRGEFPQMVWHTPLGDKYHLLPSCPTLEGSRVVKEKGCVRNTCLCRHLGLNMDQPIRDATRRGEETGCHAA